MQTLTTEQLREMMDKRDDLSVINVLSRDQFDKEHIPNTENIPLSTESFVNKVEEHIGGKDKPVVVYCASTECDASPKAAMKLEEAGFKEVYDYEGGTAAWREAGRKLVTA